MFKIIKKSKKKKNYLVTIAIGKKYYSDWFNYALPTWKKYCEKHDIGIIVITRDLVDKTNSTWKKATWQKLILGSLLSNKGLNVENVCYLDTDILINFHAPDIFYKYNKKNIAVVSQVKNLEQPLHETLRKIAFLRHNNYSSDYPLDSALFMSVANIYKYHNLKTKNDYFCAGLFIFNVKNHSKIMRYWFNKYNKNIHTLTGGGDEPILNYEFLNYKKITWLNYKFQALWIYEIAWKYPFLYNFGRRNKNLIKICIESSLMTNYFLHFAGSWYESDMWKTKDLFKDNKKRNLLKKYQNYLNTKVIGKPKGIKKPKKN